MTGAHADCVLAFARSAPDASPVVVTVVAMRSVESWGDTAVHLPEGTWRNVLTDDAPVIIGGTQVAVTEWLDAFPVAVLDRTDT